jgi:hypothetical protein
MPQGLLQTTISEGTNSRKGALTLARKRRGVCEQQLVPLCWLHEASVEKIEDVTYSITFYFDTSHTNEERSMGRGGEYVNSQPRRVVEGEKCMDAVIFHQVIRPGLQDEQEHLSSSG